MSFGVPQVSSPGPPGLLGFGRFVVPVVPELDVVPDEEVVPEDEDVLLVGGFCGGISVMPELPPVEEELEELDDEEEDEELLLDEDVGVQEPP